PTPISSLSLHDALPISEPQRLHYFFHWLVPAKLAVRLLEQLAPRRTAQPSLPKTPPPPINIACYLISRLEQVCFTDFPLPLGSRSEEHTSELQSRGQLV